MNEGQGGLNSGGGALNGAGDFGAFNNNAAQSGGATMNNFAVKGAAYSSAQRPIMNTSTITSTGDGDVVIQSHTPRKGWKKWLIGGVAVVVVVIIGVVLFKALWTRSAEDVRNAYWSYANYLIRGEESEEAFSDWNDGDAMVKEAFKEHNEAYFNNLKDAFDRFHDVFKRGPEDIRVSLDETVQELDEAISFAVSLNEVGILDKGVLAHDFENGLNLLENERDKLVKVSGISNLAQGYVDKRLGFVEIFEKYLKMSSAAGCELNDGDVDVWCLILRNVDLEGVEKLSEMNDFWYKALQVEREAVARLMIYSQTIGDTYMEEKYVQED